MRPILYPENEKLFVNNGIGILTDATQCYVTQALNGEYELEMKYPVRGIHFGEITRRKIIFAKAGPKEGKQPFRIYRISKPMSGIVTVYARHVAYDMMGIPVSPFSAETAAAALTAMKNNAAVDCPFTFYTDATTEATMEPTVPVAMWSLLGGAEGSALDHYGGEYEFDRWMVRLWQRRGENRGVSIRYGKNLTSLQQDENCAGCYTGVYPYWANTEGGYKELPEKIVNTPGSFSYTRVLTLDLSTEWAEEPTEDQLRSRVEQYISDNDIGTPDISWKIEFVQLEQTEEYKGKALLEQVMLGDTVAVEFADMGISASARAVEFCYDALLERYSSVTLGKVRASLADIVVNQQKEISKKPSQKVVNFSIQTLTSTILGAKGGSVRLLDDDGDGLPDTLYIADKADPDTASKVWRFNYEGWGASQNGYNGPFILGATIDGGFLADFIVAGKLTSTSGKSYFDLDAGKIVTDDITATGGTIGGCEIVDGELKVGAANITGTLVASQIDATNLKVAAANITGTLAASQIDATNLKVAAANITGTITAGAIVVKNSSGLALLSAGDNAVTIAGFQVDSNSFYSGNSFATAECFICTGSSAAMSIGGSESISGWMIKAGSNFGVTKAGAVYASAGNIGTWNIGNVDVMSATGTVYSGQALYSDEYYDAVYGTQVAVAMTQDTVYIWGRDSSGAAFVDSATWGAIIRAANS